MKPRYNASLSTTIEYGHVRCFLGGAYRSPLMAVFSSSITIQKLQPGQTLEQVNLRILRVPQGHRRVKVVPPVARLRSTKNSTRLLQVK